MSAWSEQFIRRFALEERTDDYTDRPHADLWSGSGVSPAISHMDEGWVRVSNALPESAEEVEEWASWPYRIVWRIRDERAHVTYCEGDVSLLIARSDEDFEAIGRSASAYYEAHV